MAKKRRDVPLSGRVSPETKETLTEMAEERGESTSAVFRELLQESLESEDEDDRVSGRSVSALTILGVVSIALAPTMLAVGQVVVGGVLSMLAGIYGLLWVTATDVVVEEAIADARDELREAGGVVALFRTAFREDRVVEDPETLVERLTYGDVLAFFVFSFLLVLSLPMVAAYYLGYMEPLVQWLGGVGALAYVVALVGLAYLGVLLFGLSSIASLAVVTASGGPTPADDTSSDVDAE